MNPIGSEAQRQRFFPNEHSQIIIIGIDGKVQFLLTIN
jgi:hypothetical protein